MLKHRHICVLIHPHNAEVAATWLPCRGLGTQAVRECLGRSHTQSSQAWENRQSQAEICGNAAFSLASCKAVHCFPHLVVRFSPPWDFRSDSVIHGIDLRLFRAVRSEMERTPSGKDIRLWCQTSKSKSHSNWTWSWLLKKNIFMLLSLLELFHLLQIDIPWESPSEIDNSTYRRSLIQTFNSCIHPGTGDFRTILKS